MPVFGLRFRLRARGKRMDKRRTFILNYGFGLLESEPAARLIEGGAAGRQGEWE